MMSPTTIVSNEFKEICPQFIGVAISATVKNSTLSAGLWQEIDTFCSQLQQTFTTETIKQHSGIHATRQAYKLFGKDPSRYRPACEQLARRILQGKGLYAVDTLVDLVNFISLYCGYSTAALDQDKIKGDSICLGIGKSEEPYEAIGRGTLNIENLPVYRDEIGGIATPTSDNVRTMISGETKHLVILINAYDGNQEILGKTLDFSIRLLKEYAEANDIQYIYYK